ncbi:MAG TPA: T9SS type A sorting domain-containing protein [Chitinophagales bacterium]|nr:T9SS type A sorting domain-containing protein [Chitinophagales bacterium]
MNKLRCLIILFLSCRICSAQNLVPNGDFESYSQLPSGAGQYSLCTGWSNCGGFGSPDYFHLNGSGQAQLPNPFPATVYPYGGSAIMGLILYDVSYPDFREYISHSLLNPLTIGETYHLSFYVTNGTPPIYYGGSGCDHFSVAFSTMLLSQTNPLIIDFTPQYIYNGFLYNNDWQQVTFNFTADSAYQYITFGSFVNDAVQQLQPHDSALSFSEAYYFIDDIVLESPKGTGINETNSQENSVIVFPQLFSDVLNIRTEKSDVYDIFIYDIASRKILQQEFINSVTLNTELLAKGIYVYEIRNKNGVIKKGKIVKE